MTKKAKEQKSQEQLQFDVFNEFEYGEITELVKDAKKFSVLNSINLDPMGPDLERQLKAASDSLIKLARWHKHLQRVLKCTTT